MKHFLVAAFVSCGSGSLAQDVVVIGEVHDNPDHHRFQSTKVSEIRPAAVVFEMISAAQAEKITDDIRADAARLAETLDWAESGWPDFSMYYPIFEAAPQARIFGAFVPGPSSAHMMDDALSAVLDRIRADYGLDRPLPAELQAAREALQMAAHCDALPESALPAMVDAQRLRDAALAEAARVALEETGGPVVVITGNGHARPDWGMPALLRERAPGIDIVTIGQTEDDEPLNGWFDEVISAPSVDRPDPCLAFR